MSVRPGDDLMSQIEPGEWIVSGFFTPDYRHWAERLAQSLDAVGAPYRLMATEKAAGGWESNTMRKPIWVREAMAANTGRVVIFLDVDCVVLGDLAPLAALDCDIAAFFGAKLRTKRMRDRLKFGVRSGTLVLPPTQNARKLVDEWIAAGKESGRLEVDQATLMLAMTRVSGLKLVFLDAKWCATEGDTVNSPVVQHSAASREQLKLSRWFGRQ